MNRLAPFAFVAAVGGTGAGAATLSHEEVRTRADGTQYTVHVEVKEPQLKGTKKRYQKTLATNESGAAVTFRVEDGKPSCRISQQGVDKIYASRKTGLPVDARSNVSFRLGEVDANGVKSTAFMMGFPIAETGFSSFGSTVHKIQVGDVRTNGVSNYMMVSDQPAEAVRFMAGGQGGTDVAFSETKLVNVTYRSGSSLSGAFDDCVTNYMNNPEKVEEAIAQATKDFGFTHRPAADASKTLRDDLIGGLRDDAMKALIAANGKDTAQVVELVDAKGGDIPVAVGLSVPDPHTGNVHTTFACYAKEVRGKDGTLLKLTASQTVLQGRYRQACLTNSEATAKRTETPVETDIPVSVSAPRGGSGGAFAGVAGGGVFGGGLYRGGDSFNAGDNFYVDDRKIVVCGNLIEGDVNGPVSDSFNNCNIDVVINEPVEPAPAPVPLPSGLPLLLGGLGLLGFAAQRKKITRGLRRALA